MRFFTDASMIFGPTLTSPHLAVSLIEKRNHDCVFWAEGVGCTVYEQRPRQCRTWPFWRISLEDRSTWDEQARGCPGMNRGALHGATGIAASAANDGLPA